MLKHAGVDQFALPERLASMDADQVEHFIRMHQRQATVVARHVDDLVFIERFLRNTGWAADLEDRLTGQLPMPEEDLKKLVRPPPNAATNATRLEELFSDSPFADTRRLAAVTRMGLPPLPTVAGIFDLAREALESSDGRIKDEAAMVFSHWRLVTSPFAFAVRNSLTDALLTSAFAEDAGLGLLLLGEPATPSLELLSSTNPDSAFQAAMAFAEPEPLLRALRNPDRRFAAAWRLAATTPVAAIGPVLAELGTEEQVTILERLRRNDRSIEMLHDALLGVAESGSQECSQLAIGLVARMGRPDDAIRLVGLTGEDHWLRSTTIQTILQRMEKSGEVETFCRFLVEEQCFGLSQYGVTDLASDGRLRDDFVPTVWARTIDDEGRKNLLRFAEEQLIARGDETLHAFVLEQMFGPNSAELRAEAWWVLKRWYSRDTYGSSGPLRLEVGVLTKYFGSVPTFLDCFVALLQDRATLAEITLQEKLADMLRYCDNGTLPGVVAHEQSFARFRSELGLVVRDDQIRLDLRSSIVRFYEHLATVDGLRDQMLAELDAVVASVPDLEFDASGTAARIREGIYVN